MKLFFLSVCFLFSNLTACSTSLKSTHHSSASTRYPSADRQLVCKTEDSTVPGPGSVTSSFSRSDNRFDIAIHAKDQQSGIWGIQYVAGHKIVKNDKSWTIVSNDPTILNFENVTFDSIPQGGSLSHPSPSKHIFHFSIETKEKSFMLTYFLIDGCFNIGPLTITKIGVCPEGHYQCGEEICCPV